VIAMDKATGIHQGLSCHRTMLDIMKSASALKPPSSFHLSFSAFLFILASSHNFASTSVNLPSKHSIAYLHIRNG